MKEYLNIYDENNVSLGEKKERKVVHEEGLWHREIAVWIIKDKNKVLMQKRAATKKLDPNKWALTAGHIGLPARKHISFGLYRLKAPLSSPPQKAMTGQRGQHGQFLCNRSDR